MFSSTLTGISAPRVVLIHHLLQKRDFFVFFRWTNVGRPCYNRLCSFPAACGRREFHTKTGGTFISYKSGTVQEEAEEAEKAINILGGQVKNITYFKLPDSEIDRSLVIINKKKSTPGKYPRKAGTPLKEPLS